MSELITDAMVEAGLKSLDVPEWVDMTMEDDVRAILEAAAPLIAAAAWEEGYQACRNRPRVDGYLINRTNPYQTRADRIGASDV